MQGTFQIEGESHVTYNLMKLAEGDAVIQSNNDEQTEMMVLDRGLDHRNQERLKNAACKFFTQNHGKFDSRLQFGETDRARFRSSL